MEDGGRTSFAALLKRRRAIIGLTQELLAERAGLSVRAISDLERGVKQHPYPHTVRRLAQALELDGEEMELLLAAARRPRPSNVLLDGLSRGGLDLPIQPTSFIGRQIE